MSKDFIERNRQVQAAADPTAKALIEVMKGQLLLVFVERLGGTVRVPVSEVDGTGGLLLNLRVDGTDFVFTTERKQ